MSEREEGVNVIRKVVCAFCGHTFPTKRIGGAQGTIWTTDLLEAHIRICPQHPMRKLEERIRELENPKVDKDVESLVQALNKAGIRTVASCSGHGKRPGNIALADGRELIIAPDWETAREIEKDFPSING